MGILQYFRDRSAEREQDARNLRRRHAQGIREGFAHTGEPTPIPTYPGEAPETINKDIVEISVVGDGASKYLEIDAGSVHRSWTLLSIFALVVATAKPTPITDGFVYCREFAADSWVRLAALDSSEMIQLGSTAKNIRIPFRYLSIFLFNTTVGNEYFVRGIWEEDR